jgi:hypothetical protein
VLPDAPSKVDVKDAAEGLPVGPAAGGGDGDQVVDQPSLGNQLRVEHRGAEQGEHRAERVEGEHLALQQLGLHVQAEVAAAARSEEDQQLARVLLVVEERLPHRQRGTARHDPHRGVGAVEHLRA